MSWCTKYLLAVLAVATLACSKKDSSSTDSSDSGTATEVVSSNQPTSTADTPSETTSTTDSKTDTTVASKEKVGTIVVENLNAALHQQTIQSGFVVGTAQGAQAGCQFDSGAAFAATGSATWSCQLPHGADTWHLGSVHTIKVGIFASNSLSNATTFHVLKGANHDINGDGFPDAVIGAANASSFKGQLYVFYSKGANGLDAETLTSANADATITGTGTDQLGDAFSYGDFNGDGYADIVALPQSNAPKVASVFYSNGATGFGGTVQKSTLATPNSQTTNSSVVAGDFNGDGYDDVAAGYQQMDATTTGGIYVYQATPGTGFAASVAVGGAAWIITGQSGDKIGQDLAVGDVNGDGYTDLVVATFHRNANAGAVYVFKSGASGLNASATLTTAAATTTIAGGASAYLGGALAVADVDGDGMADVITSTGSDTVVFSGAHLSINMTVAGASIVFPSSGTDQGLAAADINGDGYADLVIEGQGMAGVSTLYLSGPTGFAASVPTGDATATITGNASNDYFGPSALIDINGDGYLDVFYSSTGISPAGEAYLFVSSSTGFASGAASTANTVLSGATAGIGFGVVAD